MGLGLELIKNGDFDPDSDWVKGDGWTIGAGVAHCENSNMGVLEQLDFGFESGKLYRVSYEVLNSSFVGNGVRIRVGGNFGNYQNEDGIHIQDFLMGDSIVQRVQFYASNIGDVFDIDNVSVRELFPGTVLGLSMIDLFHGEYKP